MTTNVIIYLAHEYARSKLKSYVAKGELIKRLERHARVAKEYKASIIRRSAKTNYIIITTAMVIASETCHKQFPWCT